MITLVNYQTKREISPMIDDLTINLLGAEPSAGGHNVTLEYDNDTAHGGFSLDAVSAHVARLKTEIAAPLPAEETLKEAGAALFDQLLGGGLFRAYNRAATLSADREQVLRLRIKSEQPSLMAIPWEYLYDRDQGQWLALHPRLSLVRGLPKGSREPQPVNGPLRVLLMVSTPTNLPMLNVAAELANLRAAELTGMIDVLPVAPTYAALQRALREQQPHVFHFVGHGAFSEVDGQGMLAFCDDDGKAHKVEAGKLAPLLAGCETLGLVLLNACQGAVTGAESAFAGLTQQLIQQQIPAVIAMQAAIVDQDAVRFTDEFYAALADGRSVEQAVQQGRIRMNEAAASWGIPTFYLQASEPFTITPLVASQRADHLWQKSQGADDARRRQLLTAALEVDSNHAGAQAGMARLAKAEEANHLYAAAVAYMENQQWRDAYRALEQVQQRLPDFRDTRARLSEVLGKLGGAPPQVRPEQIAQIDQYLPILNALLEGRLTFFLGGDVGRIGRPTADSWVAGLYPPGAADAAGALASYLPPELQNERSLLQVSQYTLLLDGEYALYERLSALYDGDFTPTVLHRLLAELPARLAAKEYPKTRQWRYVLFSTTLDDLLERAFVEANQPYHLFAYRPRFVDDSGVNQSDCFLHFPPLQTNAGDHGGYEPVEVLEPNRYTDHDVDNYPIIIKLCGRRITSDPNSAAVTEDQYLNYVAAEKSLAVLPTTLLGKIRRNSLLFFGHSLQPWHLRLLWQRLRLPSGGRQPPRWAIVPELSRIEEIFWRDQDIEPMVAQPEGMVAYVHDWLESL